MVISSEHVCGCRSLIGGIDRTQEMMDFSVKNGIYPNIKVIKAPEIKDALEALGKRAPSLSLCVCVCVCARARACVCVFVVPASISISSL
jgi:D-arabinose 1-dehydrogenase-like Zn-dependent alcohol dehydrogenase